MPSFREILRITVRTIFFIISNVYGLPGYIVWATVFTPLRILLPRLYWKIEARIFHMLETIVVTWLDSGGYKVIETGDDIRGLAKEEAIVLCNHQSTADTPLLMHALHDKGGALGHTLWIMFKLFKYTNFGLISIHRRDFFIDQGKDVRSLQLVRLKKHLESFFHWCRRKWIIIFPEGGFLYKRREASQAYAKKNGYPVLKHVTLPRIGACKTVVETFGEPYRGPGSGRESIDSASGDHSVQLNANPQGKQLKWIIDVTLAYKDGKALDALGMFLGYCPHRDIVVNFRAYRVHSIPRDDSSFTNWFYERYSEKEEMLQTYYSTGEFPDTYGSENLPKLKQRYMKFDLLEQILVNTFFAVSFYIHYVYLFKPIWACFSWLLSFVV